MLSYGLIFCLAYMLYGLAPSIVSVGVVTVLLRIFEYGVNKPTRETIFSTFQKNDRYKSTVFIDTFVSQDLEIYLEVGLLLYPNSPDLPQMHFH